MLIVYVDDMKMAGPKEHMEKAWDSLGKTIKLEKPKGDEDENTHTFLGCIHNRIDRTVKVNGKEKIIRLSHIHI